jgi:xylan 1,4-beta-xylosidase
MQSSSSSHHAGGREPTRLPRLYAMACAVGLAGLACTATSPLLPSPPPGAFRVSLEVDAARSLGALSRPWRYFGADEPNYATTEAGEKLLTEMGALAPGEVYFRAHNLLTSGDGKPALKWGSTNAYTERLGTPHYDWSIVDGILRAGLSRGVRPLVEIGFMPEALSTSSGPYRHTWPKELFTGWSFPPKDYERWEELVYEWAKHCVSEYGAEEVQRWWWQTWNEPNIGYFSGTPEEFLRLNDHAMAGVRRALPTARVGGPHTAGDGGAFMERFLEHALRGTNYATGERGTPLDYVAFHAKGKPETKDGHVRMGIAHQLTTIDNAFARFERYPELRGKPVIIGESDPEGCAACTGKEYDYRNGVMYASYTAAAFPRKLELAAKHGILLEGAVTWAFTFADQPYFAGFRQVASNGLPMAVFNVFRMFARMGPEQLWATSSGSISLPEVLASGVRERPDVGVLASRGGGAMSVLVWHYHDDDVAGPDAWVQLAAAGLPTSARRARLTHYRIDRNHSNSHGAWLALGAPAVPTPLEYAALLKASDLTQLEGAPASVPVEGGAVRLEFALERHAVSLVVLDEVE